MTTIAAEVVADSFSPINKRITSVLATLPWEISPELLRHRAFSFSSATGRGRTSARAIREVEENPFIPLYWPSEQPGMQGGKELEEPFLSVAKDQWMAGLRDALVRAKAIAATGVHKTRVNRILAPYSHIRILITATEWENFFYLRCHQDAEPHMRMLAEAIREAIADSHPQPKGYGDWHLPYITDEDREEIWGRPELVRSGMNGKPSILPTLLMLSAARCARLPHFDKRKPIEEDLALYDRLVTSKPMHASPMEHQATPDPSPEYKPEQHANFRGWVQHRKLLLGESVAG